MLRGPDRAARSSVDAKSATRILRAINEKLPHSKPETREYGKRENSCGSWMDKQI
jgi:hypothetical protein